MEDLIPSRLPTLACVVAACAPLSEDHARVALIRDTLARDNQIWLSRDHALLEGKFAKMAADPFDFVRGTSALYWTDLSRPDPDRDSTRFLTVPAAGSVLLAGDPHPENFGTYLPGEEPLGGTEHPAAALLIELQDLDGAAFGPYLLDVRRGALGIATLAHGLLDCGDKCVDSAVEAFAEAYVEEIAQRATAEGSTAFCLESDGHIVEDLCEQASEEGSEQERLAEKTTIGVEGRRLVLDEGLDKVGKGILAMTAEEDAQLDRLLASWTRMPNRFRELDRARRYGVGVASFPAIRYLVLWDGGDDSDVDDHLISIREVVDPPALPGRSATVPALYDSNAARIEEVAWALWSQQDADIRMAGLTDGAATFKVTSWSALVQGFNHADIEEDWLLEKIDDDDLESLAHRLGHGLAGAHARAPTASRQSALEVIAQDIGDQAEAFVEERVADAQTDLARSAADLDLFQQILEVYGPLLGMEDAVDDVGS